jgi:anti-anti-sigma regulatory factor
MNYLFAFTNLLKYVYFTACLRPRVAVRAKNFGNVSPPDTSRMWMTQPINSASVEELEKNQNNGVNVSAQSSDIPAVISEELPPKSLDEMSTESTAVTESVVQATVDENSIKSVDVIEIPTDVALAESVEEVPAVTTPSTVQESSQDNQSVEVKTATIIAAIDDTAIQPTEMTTNIPQRPAGWVTVPLKPQVTLANLNELQVELQQLLGKRVQLSGSQVQRIDTAALQLLLAFMHSSDVSVCWIDHSPALRQAAQLLGLSTLLSLPE